MGIFSTLKKAKDAITGSKLWDTARGIAKNVKNVATSVISGIAGKEGVVAKAYGKIKSWGSMALGMVFPDMDNETLTSLQSVTSSSMEAGGPQFAGTFGNSLKAASAGTVATSPTITGQIKSGLRGIHSDISTAAGNMYDRTVEFITGKPKTDNPGQWVVDKAKTSTTAAVKAPGAPVSGFITSDKIYDQTSKLGVSQLVGKPAIPIDITKQPLNVQYKAAEDLAKINKYDLSILDKSRELGVSPFAGVVEGIQKSGQPVTGTGMTPLTIGQQPQNIQFQAAQREAMAAPKEPMVLTGDKSNVYRKKSLLDSARNFLQEYGPSIGAGFEMFGEMAEPFVPGRATSADNLAAQRQGIGGRGSAGGDFLSQAQAAFLSKQKSQLERLG